MELTKNRVRRLAFVLRMLILAGLQLDGQVSEHGCW